MFALKKLLSAFLLPLPIVLFLGVLGLFLLCFTLRQRVGRLCIGISFLILLLSVTPFLPNFLIHNLEQIYPPFTQTSAPVSYVVVLGGGYRINPEDLKHPQLGWSTMVRLVRGVELYRALMGQPPDGNDHLCRSEGLDRLHRLMARHPRLFLSGGTYWHDLPSEAESMACVATQLGVNPQDIILDRVGRDTEEEAVAIQKILGQQPFILVTSAYHMPRAMRIFRAHQLHPIAAPTDFWGRTLKLRSFLDIGLWLSLDARNLYMMDRAVHEYLGMFFQQLRLF